MSTQNQQSQQPENVETAMSRAEFVQLVQTRQEAAQPLPKLAYSPAEAAQVLGVCQETIYRLIKRGLLRSSSALRTKVIPHTEIQRFLANTLS